MVDPNWFLIALAAPFLWAIVNLAVKYLVSDNDTDEYPIGSLILFSSLIGVIVCIVVLFFVSGVFNISMTDKLILILSGVANALWIILYLFALKYDEVSSVVPWFLTIPIFGYILGYFILGEVLTTNQIIGSVIILFGAVFLSIDVSSIGNTKIKWKTVMYMVPAAILGAVWGILFKFVAHDNNFWVSSFWEYAGLGLSGIVLYVFVKKYRKGFVSMLKNGGKKILTINATSEVITIVGNFFTNYALLLAPVTLVFMVASFQPVAVLLFTLISTKFTPHILKEDFSPRVLYPKIFSIVVMIAGSVFLLI